MHKLTFLLRLYAWPFYRRAGVLLAAGGLITLGAALTPLAVPVAVAYAMGVGALAALAATLGVLVLNVVLAAGLARGIERFEAAYDAYRRANAIPDIFYEEMDLLEATERAAAAER